MKILVVTFDVSGHDVTIVLIIVWMFTHNLTVNSLMIPIDKRDLITTDELVHVNSP